MLCIVWLYSDKTDLMTMVISNEKLMKKVSRYHIRKLWFYIIWCMGRTYSTYIYSCSPSTRSAFSRLFSPKFRTFARWRLASNLPLNSVHKSPAIIEFLYFLKQPEDWPAMNHADSIIHGCKAPISDLCTRPYNHIIHKEIPLVVSPHHHHHCVEI